MNWQRAAAIQIIIACFGTAYLLGYGLQEPRTIMRTVGVGLAIVAFGFWVTARIQLGKSFSVKPKAVALVSKGIYSRIRNPIYIFSALWIVGVVLALGRPTWLLALIVLVPLQLIRAKREAQVLEATFNQAYREYRKHTWF